MIAGVNTDDPAVIAIARKYAAQSASPSEDRGPYGDLTPKKYEPVKYDPNDPKIIALARAYAGGYSPEDKKKDAKKAGDDLATFIEDAAVSSIGLGTFLNKDLTKEMANKISSALGKKKPFPENSQKDNENDIISSAFAENYLGIDRLANTLMGNPENAEYARQALEQIQNEFDTKHPDTTDSIQKEMFKIAPFLLVPGVDELAPIKALADLPKVLKLAGVAAKFSAAPIAYGAATASPNQSLQSAALESLATAGLLNGIFKAVLGAPAWAISKFSTSSPQKILENLKSQEGMPITGADVLEMPQLGKIQENVMANYNIGGQATAFNRIIKNLKDVTEKAFEKSGASIPSGEEGKDLLELLRNLSFSMTSKGKALYNEFEKKFFDSGEKLDLSEAQKVARQELSEYKKYVSEHPNAKDADLVKNLDEIINLPIEKPEDLTEAERAKYKKFRASDLDSLAKKQSGSYAQGVYKRLAAGLRNSVKESAKKSGKKDVIDALTEADKYHSNIISKLKDEPFKSLLKYGSTKTGSNLYGITKNAMINDEEKLKKILDIIGPEGKGLLLTRYFSPAINGDGSINRAALLNLFKKIGKSQKTMLFDKESLNAFNTLDDTTRFAKSALNFITRNPNGSQNSAMIGALVKTLASIKGLTLAAHGSYLTPALIASLISVAPLFRRYLLDNPKFLKWLVENSMKNKSVSKSIGKRVIPSLGAGISNTVGAIQNG